MSKNFHQNQKIATENEYQSLKGHQRPTKKFNKIKNIINENSKKKEKEENKYNDLILKSENTKSDNISYTGGNNQVSFNCNCIGKYSYKNTEAITIFDTLFIISFIIQSHAYLLLSASSIISFLHYLLLFSYKPYNPPSAPSILTSYHLPTHSP